MSIECLNMEQITCIQSILWVLDANSNTVSLVTQGGICIPPVKDLKIRQSAWKIQHTNVYVKNAIIIDKLYKGIMLQIGNHQTTG